MDGVSTIIVLLFVIVIFSSLPDRGTQKVTKVIKPTAPRSALFDNRFSVADLPPARFVIKPGHNIEERINSFIKAYAKAPHKNLAPSIASAIVKYSKKYDVNPYLLTALIARESRFNPEAVSSTGAQGLGQLMPSTAKGLGVKHAFDIDQNVEGTAKYTKYLLSKWTREPQQVPLALASYLAGPGAINRTKGLSGQTKAYVLDILKVYRKI